MSWADHDGAPPASQDRRKRKMATIDSLPASIREAIHDLGWNIVKQFMEAGVSDAKAIRRLVTVVREEDKSPWASDKWKAS